MKNVDSVVTKSNSEENLKEKTNQNTDFAYKTLPHNVQRNLIQNDGSESQSSMSKFKPISTSSPYSLKTLPLSQPTGPSVSFGKKIFWLKKTKRTLSAPELGDWVFSIFCVTNNFCSFINFHFDLIVVIWCCDVSG